MWFSNNMHIVGAVEYIYRDKPEMRVDIQGVPQNMTISRQIESRLWTINLFVSFSCKPTLTCKDSWNNNDKSPGISKLLTTLSETWRISFRFQIC